MGKMGEMNAVPRRSSRRGLAGAVLVVGLLAGCQAAGGHTPAAGPTPIAARTGTLMAGPTPTTLSTMPGSTSSITGSLGATVPGAVTSPYPTGPLSTGPTSPITPTGQATTAGQITTDLLPPPADGRFHSTVVPVPLAVLDRSTWSFGCPVSPDDLRYVTLSFKGFDGRAHTGELLVNRRYAARVVGVFRKLFAAGWPIQGMRIVSGDDLSEPSTGDGNNTSGFTCRAVTGSKESWSEHAYGLAIDLNPFQNPYLSGRTIIPGLAGAYRARTPVRPGMNTAQSLPVRAFAAIGWRWGGNYVTKKDYMHFSSTGG
jgi:hypothetical protein